MRVSSHALFFHRQFALKEPGDSDNTWSKKELRDFLYDFVTSANPSALCIFVDALDEGEQEDDIQVHQQVVTRRWCRYWLMPELT